MTPQARRWRSRQLAPASRQDGLLPGQDAGAAWLLDLFAAAVAQFALHELSDEDSGSVRTLAAHSREFTDAHVGNLPRAPRGDHRFNASDRLPAP